jgi:hypothetical protein
MCAGIFLHLRILNFAPDFSVCCSTNCVHRIGAARCLADASID